MYGTCEILCRELAAKYPADTPLMLVVWSLKRFRPSLTEWIFPCPIMKSGPSGARRTSEDQRIESGISSGVAMEIISNVRENRRDRPC